VVAIVDVDVGCGDCEAGGGSSVPLSTRWHINQPRQMHTDHQELYDDPDVSFGGGGQKSDGESRKNELDPEVGRQICYPAGSCEEGRDSCQQDERPRPEIRSFEDLAPSKRLLLMD